MCSKNKEQEDSGKDIELFRVRTVSHTRINRLPRIGSVEPEREPGISRPTNSHHFGDYDLFLSRSHSALHDDHSSSI